MDQRLKQALAKQPDGVLCVFEESTEWRGRSGQKLVVCRRPGCRRFAFTKFPANKVFASCTHPQFKLGDAVKHFINRVTFGFVQPTPDCQCETRRRLLNLLVSFALPDIVVRALQKLGFVGIPVEPWNNPRARAMLVRVPATGDSELKNREKVG